MDDFGVTQRIDAVEKTMVTPSGNATLLGVPVKCPICGTDNSPMEKYCGECGFLLSSTPGEDITTSETRLTDASGTQEYFLREGENIVGREGSEVLLSDQTVSRRHASVTLSDGKCIVQDLGSTNGTFIAGRQLAPNEAAELADGEEVKFGSAALTLKLPEVAEPVLEKTTVMETPEETEEMLEEQTSVQEEATVGCLVSVSNPSLRFPIHNGSNLVGRRSSNSIMLTGDAYVSGSHAELIVENDQVWLVDVGSTNGTLLNGTRLQPNERVAVAPNDEITFGQTALRFEASQEL